MELLVPESVAAASRAGLWRLIGVEFSYEPGASRPSEIVAAIHRFDPDFVPLWVKRVYRSPAETDRTVGYHVLARHLPDLKRPIAKEGELGVGEKGEAMFSRPLDWPKRWHGGVYAISVLEGPPAYRNEPWGEFQEFDWRVAKVCEWQHAMFRQAREEARQRQVLKHTEGHLIEQAKAIKKHEDDGLLRLGDIAITSDPHIYVPHESHGGEA